MKKVIVGLSGGVDSAVAAYLLKREGYDVTGIIIRTLPSEDGGEGRCCEIDDARSIADKIGIPFYPFNCIPEFERQVIEPFVCDYVRGLTPNPCVRCNRFIKFERMLYYAKVLGADFIATGHYASVGLLEGGRYSVRKALHAEKDQAYMLYMLTQEQLAATLMPLGDLSKQEVRRIAAEAGLPVADKPDSQEICFVTDGHYSEFVEQRAKGPLPGEGNFVDGRGNVLGRHRGITHYTVGQRKGLNIALGYPAYVRRIRAEENEVELGTDDSLFSDSIVCRDVNWMSIPDLPEGEKIRARVKIRYHHPGEEAIVENAGEGNVKVVFRKAVRAAAPGQSAVFFDENGYVIGGGIITETDL